MPSGERQIANVNCQPQMANGKWQMANGKFGNEPKCFQNSIQWVSEQPHWEAGKSTGDYDSDEDDDGRNDCDEDGDDDNDDRKAAPQENKEKHSF